MTRQIVCVAGVLLIGACGACSRQSAARSADFAALDRAYQAGVFNKDEYETKKAGLESEAAALDALDKARAAGVVTAEDFARIKSRLIAKGGSLASLDAARKAGVFTQDEYDARKRAVMNDGTEIPSSPEAAPVVSASSRVPEPAASATSQATSQTTVKPQVSTPSPQQSFTPVAQQSPASQVTASQAPSSQASVSQTSGNAAASSRDGHVLRMKMASAIDAQGFDRPMPSLSMLVPVDWQSQGATTWNIKDKCNTIQTRLVATGPDGRAVEFFPAYTWVWADDPGPLQATARQTAAYGTRPCDISAPMSASDYLRRNLAKYRPNAQVVGMEPAPKLLETLQKQARQTEQAAAQYNLRRSVRPDAARVRVRYSVNGKPMEELIFAATITTATLGPSFNARTGQMGQAYSYSNVAYVTGERAPQGQVDASQKFFELIVGSSRVNPAWQARVSNNALAMQKIEQKGIADRSKIVAQNAEDIRKINQESYENRQRSQDRMSEQFSQTIRGVETYRNPGTGEEVELSNQYGHAWVNNKGEYLLSDQEGFNPSVELKEDWQPLEHVSK